MHEAMMINLWIIGNPSWQSGRDLEYRRTSNIRSTESQDLNASHFVLQLPLPNLLKPGVKSRMKM